MQLANMPHVYTFQCNGLLIAYDLQAVCTRTCQLLYGELPMP